MITGAKVKTDKRDAFVLAMLLRLDAIPEAYIYPRNKSEKCGITLLMT